MAKARKRYRPSSRRPSNARIVINLHEKQYAVFMEMFEMASDVQDADFAAVVNEIYDAMEVEFV